MTWGVTDLGVGLVPHSGGLFPGSGRAFTIAAFTSPTPLSTTCMATIRLTAPTKAQIAGTGFHLCNLEHALIERCLVRNVGHMGDRFQAVAGFESEASRNLVVQFSEACGVVSANGVDGCGFDMFDGATHGNVVQYCYSHDNDGGMVEGGGVPDFGGPAVGASEGHVVRFNVSQNDHRRSRPGEQTTGALYFWGAMDRLAIYHNTIYLAGVRSRCRATRVPPGAADALLHRQQHLRRRPGRGFRVRRPGAGGAAGVPGQCLLDARRGALPHYGFVKYASSEHKPKHILVFYGTSPLLEIV